MWPHPGRLACDVGRPRERHVAATRLTVPAEQDFSGETPEIARAGGVKGAPPPSGVRSRKWQHARGRSHCFVTRRGPSREWCGKAPTKRPQLSGPHPVPDPIQMTTSAASRFSRPGPVRLKSVSLVHAVVPRDYGLAKISMSVSVFGCDLREAGRNLALLPDRDIPENLVVRRVRKVRCHSNANASEIVMNGPVIYVSER